MDNFSAGTRGAASAEYFLEHNYAVIFMHRAKSLEPFTRHFNGQKFLDMLELNERGPNTTITGNLFSNPNKQLYKSPFVVEFICLYLF